MKPRIVILGAGFGGIYVARTLKNLARRGLIDLTIVNRTNYFLFTPLLHEVATGGLTPRNVAEPLREIFAGTRTKIVQALVDVIDPVKRTVTVKSNGQQATLEYDYLVVATGAETNYYGIAGADTHTYALKTLNDAATIRSRVIDSFEKAMLEPDEAARRKLLSFAVVGGGATGVEVAAEMSEFIRGMIRRYYSETNCARHEAGQCRAEESSLTLVHTGKELLEMFAPSLRSAAERRLTKNGVVLKLNSLVTEVTADGLRLNDGSLVTSSTTIWAAGVKAVVPTFTNNAPALSGGRIIVDQYFRVQGSDRIFVLGDAAAYVDVHEFQKDSSKTRPMPMLAQVAAAQSRTVAGNILAAIRNKPLTNFHYHSKGSMVSVGQWFAIGEIYSMNIAGWLTWWLWRTVYLFKFASWQKRIRIAVDWTLDFFYPRDITKLV